MDYCYTCRRTLNGALVCPGCGACAQDAPQAAALPVGYTGGILPPISPSAGADLTGGFAIAESAQPGPEYEPSTAAASEPAGAEAAAESVLGSTSIAPTLHRGRAARRRQMARWKKTRRRAGVATAFALFGGGVTVASIHSGGGRSNTSASASRDNVAPVTLQTGDSPADGTNTSARHQAAPGHANSAAPHGNTGTSGSQPTGQATQPVTDSAGSTPLHSGNGGSSTTAKTSGSVNSLPTATSSPSAGDTGSGSGSGSDSGTTASNGGGTTTTSPTSTPTTTTPATTSPTSTPTQHGLCVLILCID